ncbi:MAG: adenylate/guanylate cyclase domain-containing protein [Thaumarchaeota archaeon]|nr:adenylate/guanylate cyclase domain-containing protein [Nitrososphaerota archaeon]
MVSFPYDVTEDRVRFQKSVIDGDMGYYDTVTRKFIPQETLDSLLENIIPQKDHLIADNDPRLSQSLNRIRRNLSIYQRNPSDSYAQIFLKYLSNRYLGSIREQKIDAAILFVDVVGSTKLSAQLSASELSSLIRVFSQEMSIVISRHGGFVLKYAGDAVIAYFPATTEFGNATENAIRCGKSMNLIISQSVNFAFQDFALPPIQVRISIDFGNNEIVFLGPEPDLIGHTITITSKMIRLAKPGHMVIGENAYKQLTGQYTSNFIPAGNDIIWDYTDPETGKIYPIYFTREGT